MTLARETTRTREWQAFKEELEKTKANQMEQLVNAKTEQDTAIIRGRILMLKEILAWDESNDSSYYDPDNLGE